MSIAPCTKPLHYTSETLEEAPPLAKTHFEEVERIDACARKRELGSYQTGFAEHPLRTKRELADFQSSSFYSHFAKAALLTLLAVAAVALPILLSASTAAALLSSAVCLASVILGVIQVLKTIGSLNSVPSMDKLFSKETLELLPKLGEMSFQNYSGIPIRDSVEAHQWKMELVRTAQKSIVMSGNYCGGRSFDAMLDLMKERLNANSELTISIISSSILLTEENQKRIDTLQKEFPKRFHCVVISETFPYISPTTQEFRLTANHAKALVIDYGHYFQIGGSGVVPNWTDHAGDKAPPKTAIRSGGFLLGNFLPAAYRDMDFIFHCPGPYGAGARLHVEMTKLFERFCCWTDPQRTPELRTLPFFLSGSLPLMEKFHQSFLKRDQLGIALFATGPEQAQNNYLQEILTRTRAAKKRIVIQNMYFHPSKEFSQALIEAYNRGVKIQILTNDCASTAPYSHMVYTELSKYCMQSLSEGKVKPNLELYEYSVPDTTFHKKVLVFDDEMVLTGTANVGYKSLEGRGDYEVNLAVQSKEFAEVTLPYLEESMRIAKRIDPRQACSISLKTRALASFQSLFQNVL